MSWIIVPDAVYAILEAEARRKGVTVERLLRQACVLIPDDGESFKVYRDSEEKK